VSIPVAKSSGDGRCMALEILIPNAAIRNLIPRGQDPPDLLDDADRPGQIRDADVQSGAATLYHKRQITLDVAMQRSSNADELRELIERGSGINDSYTGTQRPNAPQTSGSPYAQGRPIGQRPGAR